MNGTARIIRANSRNLPLEDDSVDLVVTSPPYFALRSYQDGGEHYAGQIGDEPTPAEFVDSLLEVTRECVRVLKPSGSLWVNLGDKYARNGGGGRGSSDGSTGRGPRPASLATGAPEKSLIGIPWRYALRCIDDLGLILRAEVIWSKPNGLPESVTDRVRRSHEQWFHFTLQPRYFSAVDEIREPHIYALPARRNGPGAIPRDGGGRPAGDGSQHLDGNPSGKLPGSVWTVPTEPLRVPDHLGIDHFAAFPTEWPRRIIQGWSPAGVCVECGEGRRPVADSSEKYLHRPGGADRIGTRYAAADGPEGARHDVGNVRTVHRITGYACSCGEPTAPTTPAVILDPFGGTGTTALVARALGRHGISVDMSADYCRLAEWRTNDPGEIAKAMRVEKPAKQLDGQLDLLGGEVA